MLNKKNKKAKLYFIYLTIIACIGSVIIYISFFSPDNEANTEEPVDIQTMEPEQIITPPPADIHTDAPTPTDSPMVDIAENRTAREDILKLREEYSNEEIIAYLQIEGTNISYPVVHHSDNEYYLNRNLYGKEDKAGSIYMDYENNYASSYEFDKNTIIYGHNMKNGSMFHNIRYYFDKNFFESHKYITLVTLYEETSWEIFSFYQTTTDFYYIQTSFTDDKAFFALALQMKLKSIYDTGVLVEMTDNILTLSTCASEGGDNRYVLNAKLVKNN